MQQIRLPLRHEASRAGVMSLTSMVVVVVAALFSGDLQPAFAADTPAATSQTDYILNSLLFLMGGFLVMWMAAGFCMLEAGLVRSKNVADICLKNVLLYSVACLMFFAIGYNLMYGVEAGGFIGTLNLWGASDPLTLDDTQAVVGSSFASSADFFFQMVFVATTASIVSGTVAERIKLMPFLVFTVILAGVIYPIQGSWKWGLGWLHDAGFQDFAGSTLVHSVGGWAALTGAYFLGARKGRYDKLGRVRPMPGSSIPLATLGTLILWMGWFGFNGASQLAMSAASDAVAISNVFVNTNMAAAAGTIAAALATLARFGKVDITMTLNGALAGLVSITAGPDTPSIGLAILIGAVGAVLAVFTVSLLDKLRIDDVVGAIGVHLVGGIWGTIAVVFSHKEATLIGQFMGIGAVALFVLISSSIAWIAIDKLMGLRLGEEEEAMGADVTELGIEAYPEFTAGAQHF